MPSDTFTLEAGNIRELDNDTMKQVEYDGKKILLIRKNDSVHAIGGTCSHLGAPLVKGSLYKDQVACPWHGACFNINTGDIEDFPGVDSVPKFDVTIDAKGNITVSGKKSTVSSATRPCTQSVVNPRTLTKDSVVVIAGSGVAAFQCATTLRNKGFKGRVVMLTDDLFVPYDRTKASKAMSSKPEDIAIKPMSFFKEQAIELRLGEAVKSIDIEANRIRTKKGDYGYDYLFLATGLKARNVTTEGHDLKGIFTLRTIQDGNEIWKAASGKHVVVIGSSWIGMEAACSTKPVASSVTVVGKDKIPFSNILGPKVGSAIKSLFENNDVKFEMETEVTKFVGEKGNVKRIVLANGKELKADVVVLGLGTVSNADYLKGSKIVVDQRGYVEVSNYLKTTDIKNVYAGGDMVTFPLTSDPAEPKKRVAIGHWQMSQDHGYTAAMNIMGIKTDARAVPFFWSLLFGQAIHYSGHCLDVSNNLTIGDVNAFNFIIYFFQKGVVTAVCSSASKDPVCSMFSMVTKEGRKLAEEDIRKDPFNWCHVSFPFNSKFF